MVDLIQSLVNKQDSFEIVRDQIAAILAAETQSQQALAIAAGEDPVNWAFDVFVERDFPIEKWLNADPELTMETTPNVTVAIERSQRNDGRSSVPGGKQVYEVTYLIDVLARGVNQVDDVGGTQIPADTDAHKKCQAAVRLVRNFLSATINRRLQLNTVVWGYPSFTDFEYGRPPILEHQPSPSIWNGRCRFTVPMLELSPEFEGEVLDLIRIDVSENGQVILSTEIDTTAP